MRYKGARRGNPAGNRVIQIAGRLFPMDDKLQVDIKKEADIDEEIQKLWNEIVELGKYIVYEFKE